MWKWEYNENENELNNKNNTPHACGDHPASPQQVLFTHRPPLWNGSRLVFYMFPSPQFPWGSLRVHLGFT